MFVVESAPFPSGQIGKKTGWKLEKKKQVENSLRKLLNNEQVINFIKR